MKPALILRAAQPHIEANKVLARLRNGQDVEVDNLEVLDEVLKLMTDEDKSRFEARTGQQGWDWGLLNRIRFERGLDPRPRV